MLAVIVMSVYGCQKEYEMVDPPMMGYDDDLDEEIIMQEGLQEYFVTQFGEGDMDGSSWENAMDAAGFRALLSGTVNLSKSTIHMSQGKYLMAEERGLGVIIRKNVKAIKGGYSQLSEGTDLSLRDIKAYPTVISGDVNGNKTADAGDCGLMIVKNGIISIEGVTFQHGYVANSDATSTDCGSGIFINGTPSSTIVELTDCVIRDCFADVSTAIVQGGPAVFVLSGQARLHNVEITDNRSLGRGGGLRCNNVKGIIFMNGCLVKGNSHSGSWGNGIQMSDGHLCLNNTTIINNLGTGGALNGGSSMMLANSTIIGNETDSHGAVRCESKPIRDSKLINCLLFAENPTAPSFNVNGSANKATSKGFNVYQRVSNLAMTDTDTAWPSAIAGSLSDDGVYIWDITGIGTVNGYATRQEVIDAVRSFKPEDSPIADLGEVFADWCGDDAFGTDGRGMPRNAARMQPGAYDAGL